MKKVILGLMTVILLVFITEVSSMANSIIINDSTNAQNSNLIGEVSKMKEKTQGELNDYIERYGSESYGMTAFVLKKIQIYSIPFCFLGVALSAIYQYVIGIRKLDTRDKGFYSLVGFVTIFIICQVLPLVFAIVIKGWRG